MARLYDDASSEYLQVLPGITSSALIAVACWFNKDEITSSNFLISLGDKDVDNQWMGLYCYDATPNHKLRVASVDAGGAGIADSIAYSANTWNHACGIFASTTDRRVLLNGANKGTNNTDINPINLDRTRIGAFSRSTDAGYFMSGMIAEVAIWDLTNWDGVTASDKADAFEAILPSLVDNSTPENYPLGLIAYWDLIRGLNDKVGGYNLTASGTAVANHPRIIQPCGGL